jgi:preprotein translocase subunit SecB
MSEQRPQQPAQPQQAQQPMFAVEKIYVKDLSLEIPHAPEVFLQREAPKVDIQMHTEGKPVAEGIYESVLTATVTAKFGDKTAFLVEAAQAGIFHIRNVPAQELDPVLGVTCPNILLPFLRETVASLTQRAGFPPVMLAPLNFEALYLQQRQQQAAQARAEAEAQAKPLTH